MKKVKDLLFYKKDETTEEKIIAKETKASIKAKKIKSIEEKVDELLSKKK